MIMQIRPRDYTTHVLKGHVATGHFLNLENTMTAVMAASQLVELARMYMQNLTINFIASQMLQSIATILATILALCVETHKRLQTIVTVMQQIDYKN